MEAPHPIQHVPARVAFDATKMAKIDCFRSDRLFVGLNCLEPGQAQRAHVHADADKFYFVVSGKARMIVGDRVLDAGAGDLVWAPAGTPHGIERAIERSVVLVTMAPAPAA